MMEILFEISAFYFALKTINTLILSTTLKVHEANTQSQSNVYNGIDCTLDESKISNIASQLSTVFLNKASQMENIKAGIYNCNCRVYAADLEGVKLDLLITQKNLENLEAKLELINEVSVGKQDRVNQLKLALSLEEKKCSTKF